MNIQSIGDLARSLVARNQSQQLKSMQAKLTTELTSGVASDPVRHLGGDLRQVAALERDQKLQASLILNNKELGQMADGIQASLDAVGEASDAFMQTLVIGPQSQLAQVPGIAREQAIATIGTVFSALNTHYAGRHLFSGSDVGQAPLPDVSDFLSSIDAVTGGMSRPDDIRAAISAIFVPGGDFDLTIYQGANADVTAAPVDEGEYVDLSIKANDAPFRDILKAAALAYANGRAAASMDDDDRRELLNVARDITLSASSDLSEQRGRIGISQERIESALVRLQTEALETERARSDLLGVDAFDVATRLEDTNARLELLYASTARAARLSFLEYMR